jgi:uncharacterized protein (DUF1697 family)
MKPFISMLRGINVSGQKSIRMADLRPMYEELGLLNVDTYLQSGNVVFDSAGQDAVTLVNLIEDRIEQTFGYSVSVLIRDVPDLQRILTNNPFLNERKEDIAKLYVTFLDRPIPEAKLSSLVIPDGEKDEFFVGEQEIFIFCPVGYGRTKLSNSYFEKKLNRIATTRNWKTVTALYSMAVERS